MVEAFAPGRELTCSVMGTGEGDPGALTVTDILTDGWYDYDAKYKPGGSRHVVPADIPGEIFEACMDYATRAHEVLGCRGVSRTDFRWDEAKGLRPDPSGDQHPAGDDAHLAHPRTGGGEGHVLRRALPLACGGCLMRPLIARRETGPVPLPRARPDPAPSRLTYRAQRLWLTPVFRALLRIGLPAFVVIASLLWYATDEQKVQALMDQVAEIRREIEDRPEFRINILSIAGAGPVVTEEVRATLGLDLPLSSFDLDLEELRARVEALPAVASASVRNAGSGTLSVEITEREPALIWQSRAGTVLIDAEGNFVAALATRPPDAPLPMIAGEARTRRSTRRWFSSTLRVRWASVCAVSSGWANAAGTWSCATAPAFCCPPRRRARRSTGCCSCMTCRRSSTVTWCASTCATRTG
jgi:hypothetical protein